MVEKMCCDNEKWWEKMVRSYLKKKKLLVVLLDFNVNGKLRGKLIGHLWWLFWLRGKMKRWFEWLGLGQAVTCYTLAGGSLEQCEFFFEKPLRSGINPRPTRHRILNKFWHPWKVRILITGWKFGRSLFFDVGQQKKTVSLDLPASLERQDMCWHWHV